MKINKLKINSFGKVINKEINLNNNINIIYGNNESGKSTIEQFIISSLYGISKNKNGKEISDYEKYKPWNTEDFSGKIEYELNDKSVFEIYRDFNKKNPQIFNSNKENISNEYNINKNKGNEFFYEQTKIEENLFSSTLFVRQQEIKLEKNNQNHLIQKIANLVGTGEDNVSFKLAMDRINRRQLDEIGTERSREKPINQITKKLENLKIEEIQLEEFKEKNKNIEENKNILLENISNLENEKNLIKELNKINEKEKNEKEKININKNIQNENNKKIIELKKENEEINIENKNLLKNNSQINKKIKNKLNIKYIILLILIILFNIVQFIFIKNRIINYILILTVPTLLIFYLINFKNNKKIEKNNKINFEKIKNKIKNNEDEINLLEKNNLFLENEIKKIQENNNLKNNLEKEKIKNNYLNKIEKNKLNNYLLNNYQENYFEIIQENINTEKLKLETLKYEEKDIETKLEKLVNLKEELVVYQEQYVNLKKLEKSFEYAKLILENSYEKMKSSVTPKFTKNLSKQISDITNGKYKNITVNDTEGIMVELENGNYVSANRLSAGTIDQIYLSLRLSMLEELSEESLPIILDETFAYWDEKRLENILLFLNNISKNRQIIIFTCTQREINILNKLNIQFNLIYI